MWLAFSFSFPYIGCRTAFVIAQWNHVFDDAKTKYVSPSPIKSELLEDKNESNESTTYHEGTHEATSHVSDMQSRRTRMSQRCQNVWHYGAARFHFRVSNCRINGQSKRRRKFREMREIGEWNNSHEWRHKHERMEWQSDILIFGTHPAS